MKPFLFPDLSDVSSEVLAQRLYDIRNEERELLVEFLVKLAVIDSRRFYVEMGFSSCFAFLTDHLAYTRSAAYRRTTAARLVARFPLVSHYLADGRLCLTTLVELRDVLDEDERVVEILDRAAGLTEEQVKELVAALRPRPAPMDLLRRLPEPRATPAVDSCVCLTASIRDPVRLTGHQSDRGGALHEDEEADDEGKARTSTMPAARAPVERGGAGCSCEVRRYAWPPCGRGQVRG